MAGSNPVKNSARSLAGKWCQKQSPAVLKWKYTYSVVRNTTVIITQMLYLIFYYIKTFTQSFRTATMQKQHHCKLNNQETHTPQQQTMKPTACHQWDFSARLDKTKL